MVLRLISCVFSSLAIAFLALIYPHNVQALPFRLSDSLGRDVLHDSVPFVFSPESLSAADYSIDWVGEAPNGASAKLGEKSFEWARINEIFVLPRGRVIVEIPRLASSESAQLRIHDQVSVFVPSESGERMRAEAPVGLFSGIDNRPVVEIVRSGNLRKYPLEIKFLRKKPVLLRDVSCSPYRVDFQSVQLPDRSSQGNFLYLGCRHVYLEGDQHSTASLEMYVFWDGAQGPVRIGGHVAPPASPNVWSLQNRAQPGIVRIEDQSGASVEISYRIPEHQRLGNLAIGLGPYLYRAKTSNDSIDSIAPIVTVYGSFFLNEGMRIVGFNATAPTRLFYSDTGVYLLLEQSRFLDQRLSMNVFLGGHALLFNGATGVHFKPSAPQGVEVIFRDFLLKRHNLSFGSFVLPTIDRRNYYNTWLRWGTPQLFGEINYISWQEPVSDSEVVTSESLGLCLGFPLLQFW